MIKIEVSHDHMVLIEMCISAEKLFREGRDIHSGTEHLLAALDDEDITMREYIAIMPLMAKPYSKFELV